MSSVVQGKNTVLELYIIDTWYPLLCATDMTFSVTQEIVLKTGPNSGAWREKTTRLSEWSASVTGLTKIENSAESLTFFHTLQESVRLVTQTVRLTFEDDEGNGKQITGEAVIVSNDINGPETDFSNATINFEGTGAYEMDVIEPPTPLAIDIFSDYWQTVNGNDYISGASTLLSYSLGVTDEILEVDVEGVQYDVITSGTPINRECIFDSSIGRITFRAGLVFDGSERVFVEFKRTI